MDDSASLAAKRPGLWSVLSSRTLRLLWLGETVSQLGDQMYLLGLPLLVYEMTGSSVELGKVLLIEGIPRALLMLVGGVFTDWISPRRIMLYSNGLRLVITLIMAVLLFSQRLEVWMLYIVAFCFGSVDAFFQPAFMAILPSLVSEDDLQASNSLMQSSNQTIMAIGPGLAGLLIAGLGIGKAILLDAFTFVYTAVALLAMRMPVEKPKNDAVRPSIRSIFADLGAMLRYVWDQPVLRPYMLVILSLNITLIGPTTIGPVVLAKERFDGPASLGLMLSAMGIGAVLGALATGTVKIKRFGTTFLGTIGLGGVGLALLAFTPPLWLAALLFAFIAFLVGFSNVILLTWFGKQIPPDMMGRFMSLYVLLGVGLAPISNALAGFMFAVNISGSFLAVGIGQILVFALAMLNPLLRDMEL